MDSHQQILERATAYGRIGRPLNEVGWFTSLTADVIAAFDKGKALRSVDWTDFQILKAQRSPEAWADLQLRLIADLYEGNGR